MFKPSARQMAFLLDPRKFRLITWANSPGTSEKIIFSVVKQLYSDFGISKALSLKGNSLRVNGWNVNKVGRAAQAKKIPKP